MRSECSMQYEDNCHHLLLEIGRKKLMKRICFKNLWLSEKRDPSAAGDQHQRVHE